LSSPDSSVTDRPRKIALQLVHHQGNESVEKAGDDLWDKHHIEIETDHGQGNSLDQEVHQDAERTSDKSNESSETESAKSDLALEDIAEFEIQWEEIAIGERIGLGKIDLLFDYL
jgi:hypothetical protein